MPNPPIIDDYDNEDERELVQMFYNQDYSEEFKDSVPNGHDRLKIVHAAGWVPGSELQRAENERDRAEAELARIREELDNMAEEIRDVQDQLRRQKDDEAATKKPKSGGPIASGNIVSIGPAGTPPQNLVPKNISTSTSYSGAITYEMTFETADPAVVQALIGGGPQGMSIST